MDKKNKKEKAYILTFHFQTNYGAVLQTLALYNTLKRYYPSVQILNYQPSVQLEHEKTLNFYSFKSVIDSIYSSISFYHRKKNFLAFRKKYLNETELYQENRQVKNLENADLYIGSDQVWNNDIIKEDPSYFGVFENTKAQNVFSYAASIGKTTINKNDQFFFKKYLSNISIISLREQNAIDILKTFTKKSLIEVLDPTLLLSKEEWIRIFDLQKISNKKYIFLYSLTANPTTISFAYQLSSQTHLPIIEISGKRKSLKRMVRHKILYAASPKEFVEYIANAQYVITDSFHSTVFSILFEKKFLTTIHKSRGTRIINLLNKLSLLYRYTDDFSFDKINKEIPYKDLKKILKKEQKKSLSFIESCCEFDGKNC